MEILTLVENTKRGNLQKKHGLSIYIKTKNHHILFDLGPDMTLFKNAKKLGLDLRLIDTVVISHGHMDHGGALKEFLKINKKDKIYIQEKAFEKYYCKFLCFYFYVGLNQKLKNSSQIVLLDKDFNIDDELSIKVINGLKENPMNKGLVDKNKQPDQFLHEQVLQVKENKNVLFIGCAHKGITKIMESFNLEDAVIGGFHLFNPLTKAHVSNEYLDEIVEKLKDLKTTFYTCHCTGKYAFNYLNERMSNIFYLSTGDKLII